MKKVFLLMLSGLLVMGAISSQAGATNLPVANYSFESNTPGDGGWLTDASGSTWVRAINDWSYTFADGTYKGTHRFTADKYPAGAPDGLNVAFVNGGTNGGYIRQIVQGTALTEGHIYTLSVYAGKRLDAIPGLSYGVQLVAGGNLLAQLFDVVDQPGTFELAKVQYVPGSGDPSLGLPLEIKLWSFGGQTNFDQVSLTNSTPAPTPIPGSVALMLSGLVGMSALGLRFRKN